MLPSTWSLEAHSALMAEQMLRLSVLMLMLARVFAALRSPNFLIIGHTLSWSNSLIFYIRLHITQYTPDDECIFFSEWTLKKWSSMLLLINKVSKMAPRSV